MSKNIRSAISYICSVAGYRRDQWQARAKGREIELDEFYESSEKEAADLVEIISNDIELVEKELENYAPDGHFFQCCYEPKPVVKEKRQPGKVRVRKLPASAEAFGPRFSNLYEARGYGLGARDMTPGSPFGLNRKDIAYISVNLYRDNNGLAEYVKEVNKIDLY